MSDIPTLPISDYDDQALADMMRSASDTILRLNGELATQKSIYARCRQELDRRQLEAYWSAHPELMRVDVGDKLVATEESSIRWPFNTTLEVESVHMKDNGEYRVWWKDADGWSGGMTTEMASEFRRAYLAQEAAHADDTTH